MSSDVFVDFRDAAFTYDGEAFVFRHLNLTVPQGQFLCLLGGNGSGKSTLAKHINALLLPDEGEVDVFGCDTRDAEQTYFIRSNAGLVFQNPDDQLVVGVLEDEPGVGADEVGLLRVTGVAAEHVHLALVGQKQRVDVLGQGGLPRAVATEQTQKLPLRHRQVQMTEDEGLPIVGEGGIAEIDEDV